MFISISQHHFDLLNKRQSAMDQASSEHKTLETIVKMAEQRATCESKALADVLQTIALDNGAPDGFNFAGFTFGRKDGKHFLELQEPPQQPTPISAIASQE